MFSKRMFSKRICADLESAMRLEVRGTCIICSICISAISKDVICVESRNWSEFPHYVCGWCSKPAASVTHSLRCTCSTSENSTECQSLGNEQYFTLKPFNYKDTITGDAYTQYVIMFNHVHGFFAVDGAKSQPRISSIKKKFFFKNFLKLFWLHILPWKFWTTPEDQIYSD